MLAHSQLQLWKPLTARNTLDANGVPTNLNQADLAQIMTTLAGAWEQNTCGTYGTGLLVFHTFCDNKGITEEQRAPLSPVLAAAFISSIAGVYSGSTIRNFLYALRAWHILHGVHWQMNEPEMEALLKAAEKAAPPTSKRKKQLPYTPDFMASIRTRLDLSNPFEAAVFACLTTTFYTAARLGEFTVPKLDAFNAAKHVKPSDMREETDRKGLRSTVFHLPQTKTTIHGEDVSWSAQASPTDPEAALKNHLAINSPPPDGPLFAYQHKKGYRPLTKPAFIKALTGAAKSAGLDPRQGHGIRIGSTLEYLLRGVPFEVMKAKGRWASDAFQIYLTKHAQILAPYMQAVPELHAEFSRITMPSIRRSH